MGKKQPLTTPLDASAHVLEQTLEHALEHVQHLLPEQKPIERFVHHNTLHAFEDLPFDQAVLAAGELHGAQPYMSEQRFRQEYERGRILDLDIEDAIARHVPQKETPFKGVSVRHMVHVAMLHMPEHTSSRGLRWQIEEGGMLDHFPATLPRPAREALLAEGPAPLTLCALWRASQQLATHLASEATPRAAVRLSELWLARTGHDLDALVHPWLIRWAGAYLDHGVSFWPAPEREGGFLRFMLTQLTLPVSAPAGWLKVARKLAQEFRKSNLSASQVTLRCAASMGVSEGELATWVERTALALSGWAGMFSQIERRPDTAPGTPPPATLADFIAVRALLDLAVARWQVAHRLGSGEASGSLRQRIEAMPVTRGGTCELHVVKSWQLFHLAMYLGVSAARLDALDARQRAALGALLDRYDSHARRALWQLAYERRYRVELLDGLLDHHEASGQERVARAHAPAVQLILCIDDREESLRRHLEEISSDYETLGAAGFFGVAMWYKGLGKATPVPLCPPVVTPQHYVYERPVQQDGARSTGVGDLYHSLDSRKSATLLAGGALAMLGWHKLVPMIGRVLAPRRHAQWRASLERGVGETELVLTRTTEALTPQGWHQGYSHEEMAAILKRFFEDMGLTEGFAPLVAVAGHGSTSVNNPHGAAYGCGACGGGHGGPNGRAFAQMANMPEVRALLAAQGIVIPDTTWFIGGYHNTTNNDVSFYDIRLLPESHREGYARFMRDMAEARRRDAHERCRRFESAPLEIEEAAALEHVEARAEDLGQPRPEYGHTANALCMVGRRAWSRGLFLDRRAFLVSYDPAIDDEKGTILERLLASVGPVGAGINLEYYFSYVDNNVYGSGSKLPHNVSGLVGVMDGHSSDLRTGLPLQMIELHEPIRLLVLVEGQPDQVAAIIANHPGLKRLVAHRWILAAVYDPEQNRAWFLEEEGFEEHTRERAERHEATRLEASHHWYAHRRDLLRPATIGATKESDMSRGGRHAVG